MLHFSSPLSSNHQPSGKMASTFFHECFISFCLKFLCHHRHDSTDYWTRNTPLRQQNSLLLLHISIPTSTLLESKCTHLCVFPLVFIPRWARCSCSPLCSICSQDLEMHYICCDSSLATSVNTQKWAAVTSGYSFLSSP